MGAMLQIRKIPEAKRCVCLAGPHLRIGDSALYNRVVVSSVRPVGEGRGSVGEGGRRVEQGGVPALGDGACVAARSPLWALDLRPGLRSVRGLKRSIRSRGRGGVGIVNNTQPPIRTRAGEAVVVAQRRR